MWEGAVQAAVIRYLPPSKREPTLRMRFILAKVRRFGIFQLNPKGFFN